MEDQNNNAPDENMPGSDEKISEPGVKVPAGAEMPGTDVSTGETTQPGTPAKPDAQSEEPQPDAPEDVQSGEEEETQTPS